MTGIRRDREATTHAAVRVAVAVRPERRPEPAVDTR